MELIGLYRGQQCHQLLPLPPRQLFCDFEMSLSYQSKSTMAFLWEEVTDNCAEMYTCKYKQ